MNHEGHLRHAFALALRSRSKGNHPFGAILVGPEGGVVLEAENTVLTDHDRTAHAERNLLSAASRLGDEKELAKYTMYASTEPCIMCAGAAYWVGIGTVVYGLSKDALDGMVGHAPTKPSIAFGCRAVLQGSLRKISIVGPMLEHEALEAHRGFWSSK